MKKQLVLTLTMALFGLAAMSQNFEVPKKGAKLYVENTSIEVAEQGKTTFDLWLVRSKVAKKAQFETPRIISQTSATFTVTPDNQNPDHYTVAVDASGLEAGSHSCTVMGKRNGIHEVTGMILSLNVAGGKTVATKDGE